MAKKLSINPIVSREGLDARIAELIAKRISHTAAVAAMEQEVAQVQARHQVEINRLATQIDILETPIAMYCEAHRSELFAEKKSIETPLAIFGFHLHPHSIEKVRKKDTDTTIALRLACLPWGEKYIAIQDPKLNKQSILLDRDILTAEQLTAVGLRIEQEESFYIKPKLESAEASTKAA